MTCPRLHSQEGVDLGWNMGLWYISDSEEVRKAGIGEGGALAKETHPDTELHDRPALLSRALCQAAATPPIPPSGIKRGGLPWELSHSLRRKSSQRTGQAVTNQAPTLESQRHPA